MIFETKTSVLPNCAGHTFSGAGFDVAGPLPSTPCWNASTAAQAAPMRLSVLMYQALPLPDARVL